MFEDEWGDASLDELAGLRWGPMPRVEVDRHFEPARISAIRAKSPYYFQRP